MKKTKMLPEIITVGEGLVEIMRKGTGVSFLETGVFLGPYPSGAPAIFISAASRMVGGKARTGFICVTGDDDFGDMLLERLRDDSVDVSRVRRAKVFTGSAFIRYFPDGNRKFIFHPGAAALLSRDDIRERYFSKMKVLHVTGSSLFISDSSCLACEKALGIAVKKKAVISFDPNIRPEMAGFAENVRRINRFLKKADILFITEEELFAIFGKKSVQEITREIFSFGVGIIALKKGRLGSDIITPENTISIKAMKVKVVDPTGAGDTYAGSFVASYVLGRTLEECGRIAGAAASLKCAKQGPMSIPNLKEVKKIL